MPQQPQTFLPCGFGHASQLPFPHAAIDDASSLANHHLSPVEDSSFYGHLSSRNKTSGLLHSDFDTKADTRSVSFNIAKSNRLTTYHHATRNSPFSFFLFFFSSTEQCGNRPSGTVPPRKLPAQPRLSPPPYLLPNPSLPINQTVPVPSRCRHGCLRSMRSSLHRLTTDRYCS